jgi:cytochrome c553
MRLFTIPLCLLALNAQADTETGKQLYLESGGYGCAVCHGVVAEGGGQAGGYIRGASLEALDMSLLSNDPMKPLAPTLTPEDRQNIVDYLQALKEKTLVTVRFENNEWTGHYEFANLESTGNPLAGTAGDLVLYNATFEQVTVDLTSLGGERITLDALATVHWQWTIEDFFEETGMFKLVPIKQEP